MFANAPLNFALMKSVLEGAEKQGESHHESHLFGNYLAKGNQKKKRKKKELNLTRLSAGLAFLNYISQLFVALSHQHAWGTDTLCRSTKTLAVLLKTPRA